MRWWQRIWRNGGWLYKSSLLCLATIIFMGVLANFLANNKPLLANENGHWKSPVFKEILVNWGLSSWQQGEVLKDWKQTEYDFAIWPLIPFRPSDQDSRHISNPPFSGGSHWLGTDFIGRDVFASMIYAIRYDLSIGIFAMLIAGIIGILLGGVAGFSGDREFFINRLQLLLLPLFIYPALFYGFLIWQPQVSEALNSGLLPFFGWIIFCLLIFSLIIGLALIAGKWLSPGRWLGGKVPIPVDLGISRLIEVVVSIPVIYLLIMLVGATGGQSVMWVILAIGLTRWTGIARYTRAEMLQIKELEYATAARSLGLSPWRIFWNHAIPNALPPVIIAMAFGVANAILLESFLAFIGLGLPPDIPTWGTMLNEARQDPTAWWLAIFPGLAIFLVVMIFNLLGDRWNEQRQE